MFGKIEEALNITEHREVLEAEEEEEEKELLYESHWWKFNVFTPLFSLHTHIRPKHRHAHAGRIYMKGGERCKSDLR